MTQKNKTKEELIEEIELLQKRIAEFETLDSERKEAEKALLENEARLRTVLETVKEGIIFSDEKGYFEVYNAEMERLTGYTKEEANESNDFIALLYPDAKESRRAWERVGALLRETRELEFESLIQRKDGQSRHVLVYSVVIPYQDRKMFLSTFYDITERKRAEVYLKTMFDSIQTGIILIDPELHKIVEVNPTAINMFGVPKENIVGSVCHQLICPAEVGKCPITDLGQAVDNSERVLLNAKGERVPIIKTVVPVALGGRRYLLESFIDITDRKWAEETMRASEAKYKLLTENLPQKIFLKDRASIYISCNENYARDLKIKAEEIKGRTDYDFFPKELAEKYQADDKRIMEKGVIEDIEEKYIQDEKEFFVHTFKTPVKDERGNIIGILGIFWDITERKKMEETSRLAQLGGLVSAMAHEVNNPLMIISGNAQLCLMEEIQSDTVKNNLRIIVEECRRAKDIIQRLLKFSRPSKGEIKEVDINKSIEAVVSIVEHQFKLVNVEIKRNYLKNPPLISVDEPQMQEVFINLINNASEAMPNGGAITITTSLEGDFLRLDFKDTGCGMSEETKKKLSEPFFSTKEKGTGLGLAVCCGIIKVHNGELKFESELNKGATATVLLPLKERGGRAQCIKS